MAELQQLDWFRCSPCGSRIVLPRQSPLGIYETLEYRDMGAWPITLLCIDFVQLCERSFDTVQDDYLPPPDQSVELAVLWEITCECAQQNCGLLRAIYTYWTASTINTEIRQRLAQVERTLPCAAHHVPMHDLKFDAERMMV